MSKLFTVGKWLTRRRMNHLDLIIILAVMVVWKNEPWWQNLIIFVIGGLLSVILEKKFHPEYFKK